MVLLVSIVAAGISARPVLKLEPAMVFAGEALHAQREAACRKEHPLSL